MSDKHMPYAVYRLRDLKFIAVYIRMNECCNE